MKTITLIIFMLFSCVTMLAQMEIKSNLTDNEINDLTSKLVMKLLLNESQKSGVTNLLKTYRTELEKINSANGVSTQKNNQELINSISSQIESLLDSKQKMKYDVLKNDWWNSINKAENN
ncbi:MAG: hypothetical protein OQK57_06625 [Ignavibacteriaceae bacterium]|nr:hypothetical protein [Ignavibacteriaceae bacterium]